MNPKLIGHDEMIAHLRRLALSDRLAPAYIFFGPAGVGKKTAALNLAYFLEGHGKMLSSKLLQECLLIEPVEETIGINEVRRSREFLASQPIFSERRTVIINDAQYLTLQAQNALLKIAEEPPTPGLLILIITDPELLTLPLQSRFQKIYFPLVPAALIAAWLQVSGRISQPKARRAAVESQGRPGDAWALVNDERMRTRRDLARDLLQASRLERRSILKEYLARSEAEPLHLLQTLIAIAATDQRKPITFLKQALALNRHLMSYNLNPRLQLDNLLQNY